MRTIAVIWAVYGLGEVRYVGARSAKEAVNTVILDLDIRVRLKILRWWKEEKFWCIEVQVLDETNAYATYLDCGEQTARIALELVGANASVHQFLRAGRHANQMFEQVKKEGLNNAKMESV